MRMQASGAAALPENLAAMLACLGFSAATPVQLAAAAPIMSGEDVFIEAETGSGKTLAYLLPILAQLRAGAGAPQVLVLAPTQELAAQIHRQVLAVAAAAAPGNGFPQFRSLLAIGGASLARQVEGLKSKPQVVVGTPGRILELLNMRKLRPSAIRHLVVDEADELLRGKAAQLVYWICETVVDSPRNSRQGQGATAPEAENACGRTSSSSLLPLPPSPSAPPLEGAKIGVRFVFAAASTPEETWEAARKIAPKLVRADARAASVPAGIKH